jgi:peptide/nickel transport system permease protein
MSDIISKSLSAPGISPRMSEFRRFTRVFFGRKVVIFGMVIIFLFIMVAIFAPWLAPYDPYQPDLDHVLVMPNSEHLLGTDAVGRDTLSRLIYGSRTSLLVGTSALCIGAIVGLTMGLVAGYFAGIANLIIMRIIDALMSFPMILFALAMAAFLGGGLTNVVIALGVGLIPLYARLMCGQVISIKENEYITASRSIGSSPLRLMLRHIIPNCLPPLIVMVTLMMGSTILAEAGLSFLGIGIEPPGAAWGSMINDGYQRIRSYPILSFAPGLAIMIVVFSFNMVGDGLRDALDPRLRGTL